MMLCWSCIEVESVRMKLLSSVNDARIDVGVGVKWRVWMQLLLSEIDAVETVDAVLERS